MLDKIKGLGSQVATKANGAVEGITSSVKGGVESLTIPQQWLPVRSMKRRYALPPPPRARMTCYTYP